MTLCFTAALCFTAGLALGFVAGRRWGWAEAGELVRRLTWRTRP